MDMHLVVRESGLRCGGQVGHGPAELCKVQSEAPSDESFCDLQNDRVGTISSTREINSSIKIGECMHFI
jgi:hypothetical protein